MTHAVTKHLFIVTILRLWKAGGWTAGHTRSITSEVIAAQADAASAAHTAAV
jgi:hypothetical protein